MKTTFEEPSKVFVYSDIVKEIGFGALSNDEIVYALNYASKNNYLGDMSYILHFMSETLKNDIFTHLCKIGDIETVDKYINVLHYTVDNIRANKYASIINACQNGHLNIVKRLIATGLKADDIRTNDNIILYRAGSHYEIVKLLILTFGLNIQDARCGGNKILRHAIMYGNTQLVSFLVEELKMTFEDVNAWDGFAIKYAKPENLQYLKIMFPFNIF